MDEAEGIDEHTRHKAQFYLRQITGALSPSNFVMTNPELIRHTLEENGANLVRGMKMLRRGHRGRQRAAAGAPDRSERASRSASTWR